MKHGILIYGPTPLFGGQLGANKQNLISALFGVGNNKKLVQAVKNQIVTNQLDWHFDFDQTESNPQEIMNQGTDLIVVLPELVKKFDTGSIPTNSLIELTSTEYHQNDVTRIISYMKQQS
ncbi:hypothetical protein [uncultured Vagococcus sp.]|uniref:hypothetical protein n=1 Tax=uncultured Vagococcus sp. TaxID=189676 RepID=UPI0028D321DC|nr:hypothetical protein [uncultured Vagococcus sp.]